MEFKQTQNQLHFIQLLRMTMAHGLVVKPRGSEIREIENLQLTVHPEYPFMNFPSRKYNINYFKQEMIWKLGADPYDESIKQHAKMWESAQNSDGSFNSNYGQYWFGEQLGLHKAFNELVADRHSRRAVIPMLRAKHVGHGVNDTVCTGHITFHIRENKLNASVSMRSSDQIFGLGTDIPTFAVLQRMLTAMLATTYFEADEAVSIGKLTITADSSHIYDRHYAMVNKILEIEEIEESVYMPMISTSEAFKLAACKGKVDPSWGEFSKWLMETSND